MSTAPRLAIAIAILFCTTSALAADANDLCTAARTGDTAQVTTLLAAGLDINALDDTGLTALHHAARANHPKVIQLLADLGADLNPAAPLGETPLHIAAARLHAESITALLAAGANPNARTLAGQTPLHVLGTAARVHDDAFTIRCAALAQTLITAGAAAELLDDAGATAWPHAEPVTTGDRQPSGYPTYDEIVTRLQNYAATYPAICEVHDLGPSSTDKNIWALRITDNIGIEEDEPEFKYLSTIHGDEVTGVILCLNLIDLLLTNYGSNPRLSHIVNSIDLWVVPCVNPYGYINNTRTNRRGVDLNRNFPEGSGSSPDPNTTDGREVETATIMNWSFGESFTAAVNYHGGELVVNYPFDNDGLGSTFSPTPDEDLMVYISEVYTVHNQPMWTATDFYHGITNGAAWYSIDGGMQDWDYRYMGGNELTIEVSHTKSPAYSQMPTFWSQNQESMLSLLETCLIGIRGIVTDVNTGEPVAATVTVVGRDHPIYTDPDIGDYHRMLLPGTYSLTFEAQGYDSVTVPNIVVNEGDATVVNVQLGPSALLTYPNGGETLSTGTATTVTWLGNPAAQFHLQYSDNYGQSDTSTDGFESGALGPAYSTGGDAIWTTTTYTAHGGTYAARAGDIDNYDESWMTREVTEGELSFWYRVSSEDDYDWFNFYIDGTRLIHVSGNGSWTSFTTTVPAGTHVAKWEFTKDVSESYYQDTVFIDDIAMMDDQTSWNDIIQLTEAGATNTLWTPATVSDDYKLRIRAYYGGGVYGDWDESDGLFAVEEGPQGCAGDVNCDGVVDYSDIDLFVEALSCVGGAGWEYACPWLNGDCNDDGNVTYADIDPFVGRIGATCP